MFRRAQRKSTRRAAWSVPWLVLGVFALRAALAQDPAGSGTANGESEAPPEAAIEVDPTTEPVGAAAEDAAGEAGSADPLTDEAETPDSFDRTPQRCLRLTRIDRTEVLDEQTVLFHLRGGAIQRNYLPDVCRGLNSHEPIMYNTMGASRELCAGDMIDLLHGFGTNLRRGRSCRLGQFHPTTREEVEELKRIPGRQGIVVEPVPPPEPDEAAPVPAPAEPSAAPVPAIPGAPAAPGTPAVPGAAAPLLSAPPAA